MKTHLLSLGRSVAALSLALVCVPAAIAATVNPEITASKKSGPVPRKAQLLFVQNASDVRFENGKMTLRKVNPVTIAFADRPERFAGHMPTKNFVPMWSEGKDSFLKNPPNATLSVLDDAH